jgi:carbonic anhydrase
MLRIEVGSACIGLALLMSAAVALCQPPVAAVPADQALAKLVEGNQRYSRHKEQHPDESPARRKELETVQHPFAVILSCADSRVAPELVFDQGLGDLFVIRIAGNVADNDALGSMEYAVEHLHTKLIVVLGHEKCGAVSAAVEGGNLTGHLATLVSEILPSIQEAKDLPGDKVHNCVLANARRVARQIRESEPVLREAVEKDGVKVVPAVYALDSGIVTVLDDAAR